MKFKISQQSTNHHKDMVTSVCWTGGTKAELYSAGDDRQVTRWNLDGDTIGKVTDLPEGVYVTDMSWFPGSSDTFAISCTDGSFRLMNKNGREDKRVANVSLGAVITLKWNYDGSALATGGEDGCVKVFSRVGVPRYDPLVQAAHAVFSMAWSPDSNQILFCSGDMLTIKTLQDGGSKDIKWRAHDGAVMKVDWNPVNGLVVSSGEDRKYKVWDSFGRQLFQSQPLDHVATCVSWSPRGDYFAVGSYDVLRLCDKLGWCHSRDRPQSGSLLSMSWTPDGMQLACAGANGAVVFASVVEKRVESLKFEATQTEPNTICVFELKNEQNWNVEFRDRIVDWSIGFGHLVAATANQCAIYTTSNLNTPKAQMDLNAAPSLILQSPAQFAIISNVDVGGVTVYTYEGRTLCTPRFAGLRTEFLNSRVTSLTDDVLAVLDVSDSRTVHCFLTSRNGEPARSVPIRHTHEIVDLAVSCNPDEPLLAFVDKNRDLYVMPVNPTSEEDSKRGRRGGSNESKDNNSTTKLGSGADSTPGGPFKLHTMVDTIKWNDQADILVALADSKLVTWYHPAVVYVDRDLLPATRVEKDGTMFGKLASITSFLGSRIKVRRADGAHLTTMILPYPVELHKFVNAKRWDESVRLCRHCKSEAMWASLAAMAIHGLHLDTAEIALAATKHVDKLHFILYVKEIPSGAGRNAELALYQRRYEEAEKILLQNNPPLVYRAIKMNVRLFKWTRALDLAINNKVHVDTVLYYRKKYNNGKKETDARFIQYFSEVELDEEALKKKREQEREQEESRSGGGHGGGGKSGY